MIAPKAGIDGTLLSITGRYAIALYPHLDRLTDATADPQQIISMIIALHATTPDIGDLTPIDDLRIRDRPTLEAVLADPRIRGDGPYAAAFVDLIWQHRTQICESFACYDATAASLGDEQRTWVITHGGPKANNTMITASGRCWSTGTPSSWLLRHAIYLDDRIARQLHRRHRAPGPG